MIPVAGLHNVLPRATIKIRTWAPVASASAVDAYGRRVDGTSSDTTERMPAHPATSRRLRESVPEADKDRELLALYPLAGSALARKSGARAPEVLYKGRWYKVVRDGDYEDQGGVRLVIASLKDGSA